VSIDALDRSAVARGPLERCVGDPEAFLGASWGRRASLHRGADPTGFADLLDLDDVDRFVTTTALRVPFLRLVRADQRIPEAAYTRSGRTGSRDVHGMVDPARVTALFEDGATIVLQGLHRWSAPVTRFCRELELELAHPCQVNAYITPPGAQGLASHEDPHDVFVLQAFGAKRWHVEPETGGGDPLDAELDVGDVLYMPRGTPHSATTQRTVSGHLTVGVHVTDWREVLREVVADLGEDPSLEGDVPAGWIHDPDGFATALAARLQLLAVALRDGVDPYDVVDRRTDAFLSSRAQLMRGALTERASPIEIDDATLLRRRPGAICVLRVRGDTLTVLLGDRRLEMPAWVAPAMRRLATADEVRVGDLAPDLPSASSRAVLARRLVREGLFTASNGA
jgi:bifunctional lysine-specific demethylase and histidyl-hydroxylase NO66